MVLIFGLSLGGFLAILGIASYLLAARVRLNPALGFSYRFLTHEVWCRCNRAGGVQLASVGVIVMVITAILAAADVEKGVGVLSLALVAALLVILSEVWLYHYVKRLVQRITQEKEL